MTKKQKEDIIKLIKEFTISKEVSELKILKEQIRNEITDCPFEKDRLDGISFIIANHLDDVDLYIKETEDGNYTRNTKSIAGLSLFDFLNLVDTSLLPD